MTEVPSRQEMFERAVRGLAGQGWKRAVIDDVRSLGCMYLTDDGRRCAWGHVDPNGTVGPTGRVYGGSIRTLTHVGHGLAPRLSEEDLDFALLLQGTHDHATNETLRSCFVRFGKYHNLTWPADVE